MSFKIEPENHSEELVTASAAGVRQTTLQKVPATIQLSVLAISVSAGMTAFLLLCGLAGEWSLPINPVRWAVIISLLCFLIAAFMLFQLRSRLVRLPQGTFFLATLASMGTLFVLTTLYNFSHYLVLPADLLTFAESPFVNDILKFKLGEPIYTAAQDNNSYPYTPGTPILTYLIASVLGLGESIPTYRFIQFSYVALAALLAAAICHSLVQLTIKKERYSCSVIWFSVWAPLLFLVATDLRFNEYVHSLHNDGLALLVSMAGYWLLTRYAIRPHGWVVAAMAVLPTFGFLVKQSQAIWLFVFLFFLILLGSRLRSILLYFGCSLTLLCLSLWVCYVAWGDNFLYWIFEVLGRKEVSLLRSGQHLLEAGFYAVLGLLGGWILILRNSNWNSRVLFLVWLGLFGTEVYTSGLGWHRNHLGPGVVLAACWFLAAMVKIWDSFLKDSSWFQMRLQQGLAVSMIILIWGGLGVIREPRNSVPEDFYRYVAEIEGEFEGYPAETVLMDTGNWIYLRRGVLMKDRSETIGIWLGANEPDLDRSRLRGTINRINQQKYSKILARQLDTKYTWYDFLNIGSGVPESIFQNYREVRRIRAVEGITFWWPQHLLSEILVLEPKNELSDFNSGISPAKSAPAE